MRRCRSCGKFAPEDNVCTVCGKPPTDTYGLGNQMERWDDDLRKLWVPVVEMDIRNIDKYFDAVWER
jgi:uncharacterized membrane protein YvbJ